MNKSNNNNISKKIKDSTKHNNVGGIGGYNIGSYNFSGNNNNNVNNNQLKSNNSESIIEEVLDGVQKNINKEKSIKKNSNQIIR